MSGVVVGKSENGSYHFFTDGGVFDSKGVLIAIAQKTHMLAHMPAALTVLGPRAWATVLYAFVASCATFDGLRDTIISDLRSYEALIKRAAESDGMSADFQIFMAGYSHRENRLAGFMVASNAESGVKEPYVLQELLETMVNPAPDHVALKSVVWEYPESINIERDGLKLMQAQRKMPFAHGNGAIQSVVGGFIQHTVVSSDQVTTRIVHRWDDKVGESITAYSG
jgi:hypothetical protein